MKDTITKNLSLRAFLLSGFCYFINSPAINTAADEDRATTISGSPKKARIKATIVPATAVIRLPVLKNIAGIVIALSTA